jgi:hypothetical protein
MSGINKVIGDGGWCWFHEPRVITVGANVWFGAVSSGHDLPSARGDVIAVRRNVQSGRTKRFVLNSTKLSGTRGMWANDHNAPALLELPNRRILAAYTQHGVSKEIYFGTFSGLTRRWSRERTFVPSHDSKVTYSNLVYLSSEDRVYNFFRGLGDSWKPSWAYAEAKELNWKIGGILIEFRHPQKHRPYFKVCSNGIDTIHFAYTEGHPRDFPNSIYHVAYKSGVGLCETGGSHIAPIEAGLASPLHGTLVFQGDEDNVSWVIAVNDFGDEGIFILFSVRHVGLVQGMQANGSRISYWVAKWNGADWKSTFVAEAGPQLYQGEDDYSGLFAQHPTNPGILYISTKVDPTNGEALNHWEIFEGKTSDGEQWTWASITENSKNNNLRPIATGSAGVSVLWLSGEMESYRNFAFRVLMLSDIGG